MDVTSESPERYDLEKYWNLLLFVIKPALEVEVGSSISYCPDDFEVRRLCYLHNLTCLKEFLLEYLTSLFTFLYGGATDLGDSEIFDLSRYSEVKDDENELIQFCRDKVFHWKRFVSTLSRDLDSRTEKFVHVELFHRSVSCSKLSVKAFKNNWIWN